MRYVSNCHVSHNKGTNPIPQTFEREIFRADGWLQLALHHPEALKPSIGHGPTCHVGRGCGSQPVTGPRLGHEPAPVGAAAVLDPGPAGAPGPPAEPQEAAGRDAGPQGTRHSAGDGDEGDPRAAGRGGEVSRYLERPSAPDLRPTRVCLRPRYLCCRGHILSSGQQLGTSPAAQRTQQQLAAAAAVGSQQAMLGRDGLARDAAVLGMGLLSKAFMQGLNDTKARACRRRRCSLALQRTASAVQVFGADKLEAALQRPQGQGLVTVSNHTAALDDPLVTAAALPLSRLADPAALRWTMCATDRCFVNGIAAAFFRAVKVLPVERGAGLAQPGMQAAEGRLRAGDWVHIFPQGTRQETSEIGQLKIGVGRLVAEGIAQGGQAPLVVPLVHVGMDRVMPRGSKVPRVGQEVRVIVGDPIPVQDVIDEARAAGRWQALWG